MWVYMHEKLIAALVSPSRTIVAAEEAQLSDRRPTAESSQSVSNSLNDGLVPSSAPNKVLSQLNAEAIIGSAAV